MSKPLIGFAAMLLAAVALSAGFLAYRELQETRAMQQAVQQLRSLRLQDPDGATRSVSEWQGRVLVVNFWATWCAPCREEIPGLMRVRNRHGREDLEVIGIAVDTAANVRRFAAEFAIGYPLLLGGLDTIDLSQRLGNRAGALPYTLVLDRRGDVAFSHLGVLSEAALEAAIRPLLLRPAAQAANFRAISVN